MQKQRRICNHLYFRIRWPWKGLLLQQSSSTVLHLLDTLVFTRRRLCFMGFMRGPWFLVHLWCHTCWTKTLARSRQTIVVDPLFPRRGRQLQRGGTSTYPPKNKISPGGGRASLPHPHANSTKGVLVGFVLRNHGNASSPLLIVFNWSISITSFVYVCQPYLFTWQLFTVMNINEWLFWFRDVFTQGWA